MGIDMEQRIRAVGPVLPSDHVWKICHEAAAANVANIELLFYGHEHMRILLSNLIAAKSPPEIDAVIANAQTLLKLEAEQ